MPIQYSSYRAARCCCSGATYYWCTGAVVMLLHAKSAQLPDHEPEECNAHTTDRVAYTRYLYQVFEHTAVKTDVQSCDLPGTAVHTLRWDGHWILRAMFAAALTVVIAVLVLPHTRNTPVQSGRAYLTLVHVDVCTCVYQSTAATHDLIGVSGRIHRVPRISVKLHSYTSRNRYDSCLRCCHAALETIQGRDCTPMFGAPR